MPADLAIFLHIPRTGGTTLNTVFFANYAKDEILSIYSREDFAGAGRALEERGDSLRLVQGHFLHDELVEGLLRERKARLFTFVRHPVERLVSEYLFLKSWPHSQMYAVLRDGNISFADYIRMETAAFRFRTKNLMTRIFSRAPFEGVEPPPEVEALALERARAYAFVGIMERFDASLLLLGDMLGISALFYERQNSVAPALKASVTEEDKALAAGYNAADMRLYLALRKDFEERLAGLPGDFLRRLEKFRLVNGKFNKVSALINRRDGLDREEVLNPKRLWEYE